MPRTNSTLEKQKKAAELVLNGKPVKEAMREAGYSETSIARRHGTFKELPIVQQHMKEIVQAAARLSTEGYQAILSRLVYDHIPGVTIPWPSYIESVKLYAMLTGQFRKEGKASPAVININISKKEEVIAGEVRELDNSEE
jgi:hypothetical protein